MTQDPKPPLSRVSLFVRGFIAVLISALALWWAFRNVDFSEATMQLKQTSWTAILLFLVAQVFIHAIRVVRWGLLVRAMGPVSSRAIFTSASVGIPAIFFLPLRLGELVRPLMISRAGISFPGAMAAVVVERVADGVLNVGLFFLLFGLLPRSAVTSDLVTWSTVALYIFGFALCVLAAAYFFRGPVLKAITFFLMPIPEVLRQRILETLSTFMDGLAVLGKFRSIVGFIVLTLVYWGLNGASVYIIAESYVPGLPFIAGPFAVTVLVFAVMIPAGPGFAGVFEAGMGLGLSPFQVSETGRAVIAVVIHVLQAIMLALFAGLGFAFSNARKEAATLVSIQHPSD